MSQPTRGSGPRSSYLLFALAILAAGTSIALAVSGGFSVHLSGVRVSSRGALRPALFAILFLTVAYRCRPRVESGTVSRWFTRTISTLAPWIASIAAVAVIALWIAYGARAAGGSDSYGYVSQARLWLAGDLHVRQDFAAAVPWPNPELTFTPLGYRPAAAHAIVPTYPPGLPLLMALGMKAIGDCGAFLVMPLSAALLVVLTFTLGLQLSGRVTGALAALLTASSPTIVLMTLWPMSDVPAAALWLMSLLMAARSPRPSTAVFSGISAGIATVIRPNLAPLVVLPASLLAWQAGPQTGVRVRRVTALALACLPFIGFVAWVNHDLYGSFLTSGYGAPSSLYHWQNLWPNLTRYPRWLWETQGAYVFVFLLAVFSPAPRQGTQTLRWILLAYIAAVFGCYLFYIPFDEWWYLRFLIPAMPVMFVLSIDAIVQTGRTLGAALPAMVAIVFTAFGIAHAIAYTRTHSILEIGEGEQKFADVGRYLARELPPETIVISGLHGGSIRLYSQLRTLRVDLLDRAWLDRAIEHLKSVGPPPYLVLEESEIRNFRQRFANQQAVALVDRPAVAVHSRHVYVFSSDLTRSPDQPRTIPHTTGCE